MFRRLARSGFFLQFILFVAMTSVLWLPAFIHEAPTFTNTAEGPLFVLLAEITEGVPLFSKALSLLFVVVASIVLYLIGISNDLFPRSSFLAPLFLVFFLSWNDAFLYLTPIQPAVVLVLISLLTLMKIYGQQDPYRQIFSSTLSLGLSSLFYLPAVFFILVIWLSFLTYRITSWREWIITIIGFILPYIYLITWLYWTDDQINGLIPLIESMADISIFSQYLQPVEWVWIIGLISMVFLATVGGVNAIQDKLISIRRKTFIMVNFLFVSLVLILLSGASFKSSLQFLYIPLSFFMASLIGFTKRSVFIELLFALFLAMLITIRVIA